MLVNFNVPSQFIQFFALLRTSRSRAVLFLAFFLILLLCASRTLLLFELVHASDPLHDLRVFVLLSTNHTLSFQLCFAINDVFFQLFQLAPLCGADASTLLFFWFTLLFVLHLCLNRWRCSFLLFLGLMPALSSFFGFPFFSFFTSASTGGGAASSFFGLGAIFASCPARMKKPFLGSSPFTTLHASMYCFPTLRSDASLLFAVRSFLFSLPVRAAISPSRAAI